MSIKLYCFPLSPPSRGISMALEFKGVEFERRSLPAGVHAGALLGLGFRGITVPAIKAGGERVQGSLEIVRWLERNHPEPSLYPADPEQRAKVEAAEIWAEAELQPAPKRIFRRSMVTDPGLRTWMAEHSKLPVPKLAGYATKPVVMALAAHAGADERGAREAMHKLPEMLDHADSLVADGIVGGASLNAADVQVLPVVRAMLGMPGLDPFLGGRPVAELARERLDPMPGPVPVQLPPDWIPAGHG